MEDYGSRKTKMRLKTETVTAVKNQRREVWQTLQ
jgi:hypothetical protein